MKKYMYLCLVLVLISTFVGCGSKKEPKPEDSNVPATTEESTETKKEKKAAEELKTDEIKEETPEKTADKDDKTGKKEETTEAKDKKALIDLMGKFERYEDKGISYDLETKTNEYSQKTKMYMKGGKTRLEVTAGAENTVTIISPDAYISYDPVAKTGTKMTIDPGMDEAPDIDAAGDVKPEEKMNLETIKVKGKEDLGKIPCYVFEVKSTDGEDMKGWVHAEYGIVMKWIIKGTGGNFEYSITNLKLGNVNDKSFTVPSDVKIEEGSMMTDPQKPMGTQ